MSWNSFHQVDTARYGGDGQVENILLTAYLCLEIGQLKSLEILELMNNSIQCLPEELSKCTNLRSLFVDGNLIQELPRILLTLSRLQDLSLSRNHIRHLPHGMTTDRIKISVRI
jgi:Leucine-rich repeat (LRR) protein